MKIGIAWFYRCIKAKGKSSPTIQLGIPRLQEGQHGEALCSATIKPCTAPYENEGRKDIN
jgi:hypothetical protein